MIPVRPLHQTFIIFIVIVSGFCSLVYQTAWDRVIRYNFGGDSVSSAIVTSTFLLGLGVGAFLFKRYKSRSIGIYANVELAIGLYALFSYFVLSKLAISLGQFLNPGTTGFDSFRIVLIIVCFLFMLPPCLLMGGTLPLMFNSFIDRERYNGKKIGIIYGFNTLGASLGILSVPLLFFNNFDIPTTLFFVGGLNIALSIFIRFFGRFLTFQSKAPEESGIPLQDLNQKRPEPFLLWLSAISGFITLAMELILFRMAMVWIPSSAYNFPAILMPLLFALSLGSLVLTQSNTLQEGYFLRLAALFLFSSLGIIWAVFFRTSFPEIDSVLKYFFYFAFLVFPYAFFQGGIFPILLRIASAQAKRLPSNTGFLYLVNSIGAFFGGIFFQFYFLPVFGTKAAVLVLIFFGMAVSAGVFLRAQSEKRIAFYKPKMIVYLILFVMIGSLPWVIGKIRWNIFTYGMATDVFEGLEGVTGVATIDWNGDKTAGGVYVNGQYMSALPDHPKHVRLAVFPLSFHNRERVLVLGLGGGGMIRELAKDAKIKQIDVVDWSYELPEILSQGEAEVLLGQVLKNPKVKIFNVDARVAVSLFDSRKYDLIVDNLAITHWVGATSIKSVKYFREVSRILKQDGLYVLDINTNRPHSYRSLLSGLVRNFNFLKTHNSSIILSSNRPIQFNRQTAHMVLESRKAELNLSPPYTNWLFKGMTDISKPEFLKYDPIRDELLVHEYFLLPIDLSRWQSLINRICKKLAGQFGKSQITRF
ncbi:MAG: methyltransferase domain-containing protein [Deltaproteobacteria bacterium]|nr:methyltransferase domain-containing protein [Deltaproteobacteria bacterium]